MNRGDRVFVAGHRGLVGSALTRCLEADGFGDIITRTHAELDLTRQADVNEFIAQERPAYVFLAAAKVGGILANDTYPAEFIVENLQVQTNVIDAAYRAGVKRLLFLGSSCVYPRNAAQPMKEEYLLTGPLEPTNEAYAVAKLAGIEMCHAYRRQYGVDFISVLPTNLYGPHDNFDLASSHVLPALIRKFHEAKCRQEASVTVWGSGTPRREFMHVDDMARACVFLMGHADPPTLTNIGWGKDSSIAELAALVREVVGFGGDIIFDASKPDGTPRKLLDVSRLESLGFHPAIPLRQGIADTYDWYVKNSERC